MCHIVAQPIVSLSVRVGLPPLVPHLPSLAQLIRHTLSQPFQVQLCLQLFLSGYMVFLWTLRHYVVLPVHHCATIEIITLSEFSMYRLDLTCIFYFCHCYSGYWLMVTGYGLLVTGASQLCRNHHLNQCLMCSNSTAICPQDDKWVTGYGLREPRNCAATIT